MLLNAPFWLKILAILNGLAFLLIKLIIFFVNKLFPDIFSSSSLLTRLFLFFKVFPLSLSLFVSPFFSSPFFPFFLFVLLSSSGGTIWSISLAVLLCRFSLKIFVSFSSNFSFFKFFAKIKNLILDFIANLLLPLSCSSHFSFNFFSCSSFVLSLINDILFEA